MGRGFLAEAVRRGGQKAVLQVFLHGGAGGAELVLAVVVQRIPVVSTVSLVADGLLQCVPQSAGRQRSAGEAVQPLARNLAEYLFRGFFPLGQIRQGVFLGGVQIGVIVIAGMASHGVSLLPHAAGDLGIFLHVFAHHKEGGLDIVFLQYIQNLFGVVGIGAVVEGQISRLIALFHHHVHPGKTAAHVENDAARGLHKVGVLRLFAHESSVVDHAGGHGITAVLDLYVKKSLRQGSACPCGINGFHGLRLTHAGQRGHNDHHVLHSQRFQRDRLRFLGDFRILRGHRFRFHLRCFSGLRLRLLRHRLRHRFCRRAFAQIRLRVCRDRQRRPRRAEAKRRDQKTKGENKAKTFHRSSGYGICIFDGFFGKMFPKKVGKAIFLQICVLYLYVRPFCVADGVVSAIIVYHSGEKCNAFVFNCHSIGDYLHIALSSADGKTPGHCGGGGLPGLRGGNSSVGDGAHVGKTGGGVCLARGRMGL